MQHNETKLQASCIKWFDLAYNNRYTVFYSDNKTVKRISLLIALHNGIFINYKQARIMKQTGTSCGAADLFLSVPNSEHKGLYIELKFGKGRQAETQKQFQILVERQGYRYEVINDINKFINLIIKYLNN